MRLYNRLPAAEFIRALVLASVSGNVALGRPTMTDAKLFMLSSFRQARAKP